MNNNTPAELIKRIQFLEHQNRQLMSLLIDNHISLPEEISDTFTPEIKPCSINNRSELITVDTETNSTHITGSVSRSSPLSERISLYMSLFRGRPDVYAKYWESANGKCGYSPVCQNRFNRSCPGNNASKDNKKKFKCAECSQTAYEPFTSDVVQRHLEGKDIFGIYTILPGDLCNFLAIDFDEDDWKKAASQIREVCKELNIPCAVEISRSGNGAHIWFFFEQEENAAVARRFGSQLIGRTLNKNGRLSFRSYDRMFPNQDTMPAGGIGNLIALPLQPKAAKEKHGSLFVDENFQIYRDQWTYLSTIQRVRHTDVIRLAEEMTPPVVIQPSNPNKPWVRAAQPTAIDFPKEVHITLADRMYVLTSGLSDKAVTAIKSLAAFRNPNFYKHQKMRQSTYGIPRYFCSAEFDGDYLVLPRGCFDSVSNLLSENGVHPVISDERQTGKSINVCFTGSLRDEQPQALKALAGHETGILSAATAFGKTVVAAALIAERKVNTLVLVHRDNLLSQWQEKLSQYLNLNEALPEVEKGKRGSKKKRELIGRFSGRKDTRSGYIDIATIQSLNPKEGVRAWIGDYSMVIVDECHHIPAQSFETIMKSIPAKNLYGLTATPTRQDGLEPLLYMYLGPVRYTVDALTQAMLRPFSHQMIPRFTGANYQSDGNSSHSLAELYNLIAKDELRNALILEDVSACIKEKRSCLVLSERKEHLYTLAESIRQYTENTFILVGGEKDAVRQEQFAAIRSVSPDEALVICSTGRYIGEGFDEARLDTLFLTMPIAWKGTLAQYAGRLHRLYEGKSEVRIYDYIDNNTDMLIRMYNKRLRGYAEIGYQAGLPARDRQVPDLIYSRSNYIDTFTEDLQQAMHTIQIASPFISVSFIEDRKELFHSAIQRHVQIDIFCSYPEDFSDNVSSSMQSALHVLREMDIKVHCVHNAFRCNAVIDGHIVWYGGLNLLGGHDKNNILRLVSVRVAEVISRS